MCVECVESVWRVFGECWESMQKVKQIVFGKCVESVRRVCRECLECVCSVC